MAPALLHLHLQLGSWGWHLGHGGGARVRGDTGHVEEIQTGPAHSPHLTIRSSAVLLRRAQLHGPHRHLPGRLLVARWLRGWRAGHTAFVSGEWPGPRQHVEHRYDGAWPCLLLLSWGLGWHHVEGGGRGTVAGGSGARGLEPRGLPAGGGGRCGRGVCVQGAQALFLPVALGFGGSRLAPVVLCGRGVTSGAAWPMCTPRASPTWRGQWSEVREPDQGCSGRHRHLPGFLA